MPDLLVKYLVYLPIFLGQLRPQALDLRLPRTDEFHETLVPQAHHEPDLLVHPVEVIVASILSGLEPSSFAGPDAAK